MSSFASFCLQLNNEIKAELKSGLRVLAYTKLELEEDLKLKIK